MPRLMEYIKDIKSGESRWDLVEIGVLGPPRKEASRDVAQALQSIFESKDGKIFVCNDKEILMVIDHGKNKDLTFVCSCVQNNMEDYICFMDVAEFAEVKNKAGETTKKIEKLQIHMAKDGYDETIPQRRAKRQEGIIMIATKDDSLRRALSPKLLKYGKFPSVQEMEELLLGYHENAPNVLIWDMSTVRMVERAPVDMVFSADQDAYIISLTDVVDVQQMMQMKQKGIVEMLPKPVNEDKLDKLIMDSPAFKFGIARKQRA